MSVDYASMQDYVVRGFENIHSISRLECISWAFEFILGIRIILLSLSNLSTDPISLQIQTLQACFTTLPACTQTATCYYLTPDLTR
jgi:hypothetical protein